MEWRDGGWITGYKYETLRTGDVTYLPGPQSSLRFCLVQRPMRSLDLVARHQQWTASRREVGGRFIREIAPSRKFRQLRKYCPPASGRLNGRQTMHTAEKWGLERACRGLSVWGLDGNCRGRRRPLPQSCSCTSHAHTDARAQARGRRRGTVQRHEKQKGGRQGGEDYGRRRRRGKEGRREGGWILHQSVSRRRTGLENWIRRKPATLRRTEGQLATPCFLSSQSACL